jgi:cytochrome P450
VIVQQRPAHVPAELVVEYNAFSGEPIEEQMEKAEQWRALGPVVWSDSNGGHWIVLSIDGVRDVTGRPGIFSSAEPRKGITLVQVDRDLHIPIELDGDVHRQYRKILVPLFSPRRVQLLEESAREIARDQLTNFVSSGRCSVVDDYARPIASAMFMRLMDWPLADCHRLEELADLQLNGRPGATQEELGATKLEANRQIDEYCRERIAERSAALADDMTSVLIQSTLADGEPVPAGQLVRLLRLLMIAGLDTTQSVMSQSIAYLGRHADAQEYVRTHRDDMAAIVEELLRWNTPAMPNRTATADTEICGVPIRAGDTVHCLLSAANRDRGLVENPWTVDFTRTVNRHVAFSGGPHKCIGGPLARVILGAALDEFHQAVSSYRVREAESHTGAVWGMTRVVVDLTPARELV